MSPPTGKGLGVVKENEPRKRRNHRFFGCVFFFNDSNVLINRLGRSCSRRTSWTVSKTKRPSHRRLLEVPGSTWNGADRVEMVIFLFFFFTFLLLRKANDFLLKKTHKVTWLEDFGSFLCRWRRRRRRCRQWMWWRWP